jgi:hypothetical protein
MKNIGLKRLPEFIEDDFISAIETVVSHATYPHYFVEISRVSQDEEKDLGYDGVLTSLVPFYLQFKRSIFYLPQFRGKIARDRANCGHRNTNGFFSFTLHKDRSTKGYDQHNKLYVLSQRSRAAYVAPLFYKKQSLTRYKSSVPPFAWSFADLEIVPVTALHMRLSFCNLRILHETMTFPPHAAITDHLPSHEYTYTHNGDICFHSKAISLNLPRKTLHDVIVEVIRQLVGSKTQSFDDGRIAIKLLAEIFNAKWGSRSFRSMVKSYMVDLDILPSTWQGDLLHFLLEKAGTMERFLLLEAILWGELRVAQYVAKRSKL